MCRSARCGPARLDLADDDESRSAQNRKHEREAHALIVSQPGSAPVQPGHYAGVNRVVILALALALLAACGNAAGGPMSGKTVVRGSVVLSPASPVCRLGSSCARPLPGLELVFSRNGKVAARVKSGAHGRYRVALQPGRYAVTTSRRGALRPRRVRIKATARAVVNFSFDAGIR
jgi:hypothetical protein